MSELKQEAVQLIDRLPEEKVKYVIQYIQELQISAPAKSTAVTPKMRAFLELENMLVPVSEELDYDKELEEAREEKYGSIG